MLGGCVGLVDSHLRVPQEMPLGERMRETLLFPLRRRHIILFFFFIRKLLCVAYGISSTQPRHFITIVVVVSLVSRFFPSRRTRCLVLSNLFVRLSCRFCCNSFFSPFFWRRSKQMTEIKELGRDFKFFFFFPGAAVGGLLIGKNKGFSGTQCVWFPVDSVIWKVPPHKKNILLLFPKRVDD